MNTRNVNLDLIKCLACIGVVGLHSVGMVHYTIYYLCGISVPLFFMVNGYLMFSKDSLSCSYALRKIGALLRVVLCWNLLIMLPVLLFRHKLVNPLSLCAKSLFQQGYLWHFWFLGSFMILDLLAPLLHRLLHRKKPALLITCGFFMVLCISISMLSMYRGYSIQMYVPQTLRLWTWLFYYLFGALCADLQVSKKFRLPLWSHGLAVILLAVLNNFCIKKVGLYLVHSRLADLFYDNLTSIAWYTVTFLFLLRLPLAREKTRALITSFATLTMGIYILHPVLLAGINVFFVPAAVSGALALWGLLLVLSGILSYLIGKIPLVNLLIHL